MVSCSRGDDTSTNSNENNNTNNDAEYDISAILDYFSGTGLKNMALL